MLCLLAVRKEIRRDEVVDLLWRGVEEDKARNAFRQALHRLRSAIGDDVLPQDRERLRLIPGPSLSIDLDRFESAVNAGRLSEAIDVAVGDFLEDATLGEPPFDMWVEQERARLRTRVGRVLTDATSQASAGGRWAEAAAWSRRLMSVVPFDASSAQVAATTLVAAGRRHEARDLLKQFAATLESELGLGLPTDLQTLLARLDRQGGSSDPTATRATRHQPIALPFVGREGELSQLVSLCRATAEESGGFALVKGQAGIGKTRLLTELASHIKSLGRVTVLHGREHVAGIQLPYAVFAEALRPLTRAPGVAGASRHLLAEAARLLPELRDEMELPAVADVDDDAARLRFFEGVAALIDAAAFERTIIMLIDDAHLIGPSTLEMLAYLCARLSRSAVMFIVAVNPEQAPATVLARLESIARLDSQTHPGRTISLSIGPLSSAAAHESVAQATATLSLDDGIAEMLVARAEGDPSRLADFVRRLARGEKLPTAPISFRELSLDRISRLSSSQRRLLFVIALIARPVTTAEAGAAAHLPPAAIDDSIDALAGEALVSTTADGLIVIEAETARTALDVAGPSTRAFLAGWIADELSSRSWPAAELARFFAAAGQLRPAFEHSRRASFDALAVGAVPEATHHLQAARSFATSPADAASIESLLTAIGSGNRQIRPAESVSPGPRSDGSPFVSATSPAPAGLASVFPNWRVLLGAAVATLIVSSLVLADRASEVNAGPMVGAGDTLWLSEDESQRFVRFATGDLSKGFALSSRRLAGPSIPAWIDSLPRQWANPIAAPHGQRVVVERVSPAGSDLFSVDADRRDTIPLLVGVGDARGLGWSPDGRWVLASLSPKDGSNEARLFALRDNGSSIERRVLEESPQRSVTEAAWSPDGTRIAWVARVGADRQMEVFVSDADGAKVRNVSSDPADDRHIAWSPDGRLLAFTSNRDGNSELYALSFAESRLWRLTFDPAQDDAGAFSSDSRMIAFESTRGGAVGVYIMPALGGRVMRVGSAPTLSVVQWRRGPRRYVDRVRVEQGLTVQPGDTATFRLTARDQFDEPMLARSVGWTVLDSTIVRPVTANSENDVFRLVAVRDGLARIVGNAGRWRYDTAFVRVGDATVPIVSAADGARAWRPLGIPTPTILDSVVVLRADREWDSGLLSRAALPLLPSLALTTRLELPLGAAADPATVVSVALVAVEDTSAIDAVAPQFLRYASFAWNAEVSRFVYAVGREVFTEPVGAWLRSPFTVTLVVEQDSTMTFTVNGQRRWRSSIRAIGSGQGSRVQAWISGRATGDHVRVFRTSVYLSEVKAR